MIVIGIDPGTTGALACLVNGELRGVEDMPVRTVGGSARVQRKVCAAGMASIIRHWRSQYGPDAELAVIEMVAAMPAQGVASVFSLGHSAGAIEGALLAMGCPVEFVAPRKWKGRYGLGNDKGASRAKASLLYPDFAGQWRRVKDDGRAEAVLIGAFGAKVFA